MSVMQCCRCICCSRKDVEGLSVMYCFYVATLDRMLRDRYSEFQALADKCIMTLKMEVRCQCYYYITILLQKVCAN